MTDTIHLVIVDDHPLFREGVAKRLEQEPDLKIVGQGATADDATRLACEFLPDILLLDINIPGGGLHAVQAIADSCPIVKLVMLTASAEEEDIIAALRAGARAYILKNVSAPDLVDILRAVYAGEVYVTPTLAGNLLREMSAAVPKTRSRVSPLDKLTDRERQILEGVASGLSNKEIGERLHLSEKTIKYYMTNILQKLQVRNRVEAALLAHRGGQSEQRR